MSTNGRRPRRAARVRIAALAIVLGLLPSLSACAPANVWPTARADDGAIAVAAGETWTVLAELGYGELGLRPGALEALPLPEILVLPTEDVTVHFVLAGVTAPDDWRVSLESVHRVIRDLGSRHRDAGREYLLEARFRVNVPATADPGAYRVVAVLNALRGGRTDVEMIFGIDRGARSR